ncbi:HET-domain-containing protein [Aaosphaeria arxii CBS 175.79]|uniref:HET-domain-containing protein n=1 Tax=Aaosphaeria arxii CBS 175.79 TaxID=1450172 RepID=A0A6A5XWS0_9PLEO|nr:HET-domain-containing protein [Aaosphaeria arxii CBS 175.79]KAF2017602.1 HET-domain-containing protein [Aaosphaeria arxii CBS 175.79]
MNPSSSSHGKSKPSLIVTLPSRICSTCADISSRWCEPTKKPSSCGAEGDFEGLWPTDEQCWTPRELRTSARRCACCQFLLRSIESSPWMSPQDDDYIGLGSHIVGSTHGSPAQREQEAMQRHYLGSGGATQYIRYYRPRLRIYRKSGDNKDYPYVPSDFVALLPLAEKPDGANAEGSLPFHGRVVGERTDFDMAREWLKSCTDSHHPIGDNVRKGGRGFGGGLFSGYSNQRQDGCQPVPCLAIPHFRLVDVEKRCIVLAQPEDTYAALSYVWGNSKRLLLLTDNLEELSTPGALSPDRDTVPKTFLDAIIVAQQLSIRFVWIDAICILQDNQEQLVEHMDLMDKIYSSASLTIVSDTASADSGIPGVGMLRGPEQATFTRGRRTYISSRQTFGAALQSSCWESRAWCLQEKVFSKRLLIFTESQTFYHCTRSTWFEDTVLESHEYTGGSVSIAERSDPSVKKMRDPHYTAYEAHRPLFGRNFWSLIELYTRRQLSFESDTIRAFSGILNSVEDQHGPSHWGVLQSEFNKGLSWSISGRTPNLRRNEFPSWSWAGWRGNVEGVRLRFLSAHRNWHDRWDVVFFYYHKTESMEHELRPIYVDRPKTPKVSSSNKEIVSTTENTPASTETKPNTSAATTTTETAAPGNIAPTSLFGLPLSSPPQQEELERRDGTWMIPGHPGEEDFVAKDLPPFTHVPETMPPLSHILRFYTSVATLEIDANPDPARDPWTGGQGTRHAVRLPGSNEVVGHIEPVAEWVGKMTVADFAFISNGFHPPSDSMEYSSPALLHVLILEGEGEVKTRVRSTECWDIYKWRKACPKWKAVTLA